MDNFLNSRPFSWSGGHSLVSATSSLPMGPSSGGFLENFSTGLPAFSEVSTKQTIMTGVSNGGQVPSNSDATFVKLNHPNMSHARGNTGVHHIINRSMVDLMSTNNRRLMNSLVNQKEHTKERPPRTSIADSLVAPIQDDLFDEVSPIPIKRNIYLKRKMASALPSKSKDSAPHSTLRHNNNSSSRKNYTSSSPDDSTVSLLHQSCYLYPTTTAVVSSALKIDPQATRKRAKILCKGDPLAKRKRTETFTLPIHIALKYGASFGVVKELVQADPEVLVMTDGPECCGALSTALYSNASMDVLDLIVSNNRECLKVKDRHENTSLHIAVAQSKPLAFVKRLIKLYPEALQQQNFHGQTPLDVAQHGAMVSLDILDHLQQLAYDSLEEEEEEGYAALDGPAV